MPDAIAQSELLSWLAETSLAVSLLVGLVMLVQLLLGKVLPARVRYLLWLLVVVRLLMPVSPQSSLSVWNLLAPEAEPVENRVVASELPSLRVDRPVASTATPVMEIHPPIEMSIDERTVPASPPPPAAPFWTTTRLFMLWIAGGLLILFIILLANILAMKRLTHRRPVSDADTLTLLRECCQAMGVHRNVRLIETSGLQSPALLGYVRPKLLLPTNLLKHFRADELRWVFLHELAHVRRQDVLVNYALLLLQAVHWFNPFVWIAFARIRTERELATDALVLERAPDIANKNESYGQTLLRILELTKTKTRPTDI